MVIGNIKQVSNFSLLRLVQILAKSFLIPAWKLIFSWYSEFEPEVVLPTFYDLKLAT